MKLYPVSAYYKVERGEEWGMAYLVNLPEDASADDIFIAAYEELMEYARGSYFNVERIFNLTIDRGRPETSA